MSPRSLIFYVLLTLLPSLDAQPLPAPTTERGPLPPPDLSITRASTLLHPDDTKTVTLYDASKRQSDVRYFNADGTWRAHIIYTLDADGKIKSGQFLDKKDKPGVRSLYRYDGSDRVIEETHYDQSGALVRRMVYEYGLTDRVLKTIAYDSQSNVLGVWSPKKKEEVVPKFVIADNTGFAGQVFAGLGMEIALRAMIIRLDATPSPTSQPRFSLEHPTEYFGEILQLRTGRRESHRSFAAT